MQIQFATEYSQQASTNNTHVLCNLCYSILQEFFSDDYKLSKIMIKRKRAYDDV